MARLTIRDLDLTGKRVFIRVDFNVPIRDGRITDDGRIRAALPTIRFALQQGAAVVLASHLGRPKGVGMEPDYSLQPVAAHLATLLGVPVTMCAEPGGAACAEKAAALAPGEVLLLENLRFHPGEKKDDPEFAASLRKLADEYVNDAFGTCHRAHASVHALPRLFDQPAAGFLLEKEIHYFDDVLRSPDRPCVAILGGAKVSDKIPVIRNLIALADTLLIGGAMAYTFLAATGGDVGDSRVEREQIELCRELLDQARKAGVAMELPVDHVVADRFESPDQIQITEGQGIPDGFMGLDIGPETIVRYQDVLREAKTLLWNGPMGVFENPRFAVGTLAVAEALADSDAVTIVGGGDSAAAVRQAGLADRMTHISTGGGASLAYMAGETLPGIAALAEKGEDG